MGEKLDDSHGLELTGEVLVSVMMILFFTVVLLLFLILCLRSSSYRSRQHDDEALTGRRRRRRLDFTPGHPASTIRRSLDPSALKSIPVLTFSFKNFKDTMECAVCLSETKDGEKVRILPNCNHGFHVDCIDMWFLSNSTCPICRNLVSDQPKPNTETDNSAVFPTNVLVWGNQEEVTNSRSNSEEPSYSASSSSSNVRPDEMLIEIPRQVDEDEETKSPVMKQLKSLKRLLSRGPTTAGPSSSTHLGKMGPDQC